MDEPIQIEERRDGISTQTRLTILGAIVVLVLLAGGRVAGLYVDWLWFQSVAMEGVFATRITTQVVLFAVAGLAFLAIFLINVAVAIRLSSRHELPAELMRWIQPGDRDLPLKIGSAVVGVLLAIVVGLWAAGSWDVVLRFLNPTAFGAVDPLFGQDIGFFVFTLPMYGLLHGWFMAVILLAIIGSLAIYVMKFVLPQISLTEEPLEAQLPNIRLNLDFGRGVKAHLSILVALLAVAFAVRHWLDIYGLAYSPTGLTFGAGFTDVNARWPALWVMAGAAVLFAVLALVNIGRPGYKLVVHGMVGWMGIWILGAVIYPAAVQRFEVLPSELDKERPYLQYNIDLTNQAYGLNRVKEIEYPAEDAVTAAEIDLNPTTIKNVRLWDTEPLLNTYNQVQSIRLYYDFLDVDVDRYMIDGEYRQVMLAARELSPDKLPSQAQTWVNQRLQFTHGYGVAMSPVNEVTPEGLPELFLQDVPPRGKLSLARPEIYYGENTNNNVIVKTSTLEFDYPKGDDNVYVEYQGKSGVGVGSFLRRLLFSWQFADTNILLTGSIGPDSKILYNRNIKERVQKVAPFLMHDRDPYTVVANNRLYWILDAYTHTDLYPYSQPVILDKRSKANYLRNSVKVVMDAYEGSMQFYVSDTSDPLVKTYAKIFPNLFLPLDQMPQELRSHLRYPQDLFSIQAELYRTYHMRDARVFYNREDMWNIPNEVYIDKPVVMQPYYVIMRLPGEKQEEFVLILPYTPPNKNNMITWLAARSDGDFYGQLIAYKYPKDKLIFGPMQIEARIDQDPRISEQLTLWNQAGSRVIRGNMIVIPIGQSNLYVEPIYLQSEQTQLPEMKRVILATGNKVVMEPTVSEGLARIFPPQTGPASQPVAPTTPEPTPPKQGTNQAINRLLERYTKLQEDMKAFEKELRALLESPEGAR